AFRDHQKRFLQDGCDRHANRERESRRQKWNALCHTQVGRARSPDEPCGRLPVREIPARAELQPQWIFRSRFLRSDHSAASRIQRATEAGWDLPDKRRSFAAFTVLLISIVMVMGPTPPGTGVSAPAVFTASGWTSPISTLPLARNFSRRCGKFPSRRFASAASVTLFVPTSITAAPALIQSGCTKPARPMAATRISARRIISGKSRDLEWQIVTVAFA